MIYMKYTKILIVSLLCLCMLTFTSCNSKVTDDPLSKCKSDTVAEVVVNYGTKNYTLTSDELIEFVELLANIDEFTPDDTLLQSDGDDFWIIHIRLNDGSTLVLDVSTPYITVDSEGYKVDANTCASLENYIQDIVNKTMT